MLTGYPPSRIRYNGLRRYAGLFDAVRGTGLGSGQFLHGAPVVERHDLDKLRRQLGPLRQNAPRRHAAGVQGMACYQNLQALGVMAQWILGQRAEDEIRADFQHLLGSPLLLPAFPEYMAGFLLALEFTPRISRLAVELLSRAFAQLPDEVLVPWLPKLVVTLRPLGSGLMQTLVKEAGLAFPRELSALPKWEFAWERKLPAAPSSAAAAKEKAKPAVKVAAAIERSPAEQTIAALLRAEPASLNALAERFGAPVVWEVAAATSEVVEAAVTAEVVPEASDDSPVGRLLAAHPESLQALAERLRRLGAA